MDATIMIEGKPFHYNVEHLTVDTNPEITFDQAKDVLFKAKELLDSKDIKFGLVFGTLLGAIREHSFIPYDYDVDIYIEDLPNLLRSIPEFDKQGFHLIRVENNKLYTFRLGDGAYIDMYTRRKAPFPMSLYCCYIGYRIMPKKYFNKTKEIDFLGGKFTVPQDAEGEMELCYGKTWRTPIKGYEGNANVLPARIYFAFKEFVKKLIGWDKWKHYVRKGKDED